jgi:hypothetical protein
MIKRDLYGIIVQHNKHDASYGDGGDSLCRTGIMALCGSGIDKNVLWLFSTMNGMVRHPFQKEWRSEVETSRDQIVCGLASGDLPSSALRYAKSGKVNKDWLDPSVRLYLYKIAGKKPPLWIKSLGWPWLYLSLLWNTKIKPDHEMNQFACICIVMGKWWSKKLIEKHPDIYKNIMEYWSGWRDQEEIGWALLRKLYSTAGVNFLEG